MFATIFDDDANKPSKTNYDSNVKTVEDPYEH